MNQLYYGDNLTFMRDKMKNESVDLVYLDPPFNSNRSYNLLYKTATGVAVPEQEEAFCDTWEVTETKAQILRKVEIIFDEHGIPRDALNFWRLWIDALRNTQPKLLAYLVYMAYRILELRRILRPTGSIYLHCDPTASHYIKVMMDIIFGDDNFRNEIVWCFSGGGIPRNDFPRKHQVILRYSRGKDVVFNVEYKPYKENTQSVGKHSTLSGGKAIDLARGTPITDWWTDIKTVTGWHPENLGYPTQKPIDLLSRIIKASSNEGDIVFDPFCGCGTAIYAAHLNNRHWIGCDIAILSIRLVRDVLEKRYSLKDGVDYQTDGVPLSVEGARELFHSDPHQFQNWAVELAGGFCTHQKSGDKGVDGRIHFEVGTEYRNMVLSVKGGKSIQPAHIRELRGVLEREDSIMGGFICLSNPTRGMIAEATNAGQYEYEGRAYDRLQIRTIDQLLNGLGFDTPTQVQTLNWERQLRLFNL